MAKNKINYWLIAALGILLITAILTMIFGEGALNLGALGVKVKRTANVAEVTCPSGSLNEMGFCTFTLNPMDYNVLKKGDSYVIYSTKLKEIMEQNAVSIKMDDVRLAKAFAPTTGYSDDFGLKFSSFDLNGEKLPAFTMDSSTAEKARDRRFVIIDLQQKNIKIRLNSFYLPAKEILGT